MSEAGAAARLKPRKSPVQSRSSFTVEAIVEAAAQVLVEVGYEAFTTSRAAERAGVSIGTLYQYFPNRDALLLELVRRRTLALLDAALSAPIAPEADLSEAAHCMMTALVAVKRREVAVSIALLNALPAVQGRVAVIETTRGMSRALADKLAPHLGRAWTAEDDERLSLANAAVEGVLWETVAISPQRLAGDDLAVDLARLFLAVFRRPE